MTSDVTSAGASLPTSDAPAVSVTGVSKTYGSVTALDRVDLTVRRGTVHALVGENGSGKSTLTKIVAGVVTPDEGTVAIDGETLDHIDARTSIAHGIRVIFQDLAVFPNMSVAENLTFEGDRPLLRPALGRRHSHARARQALAELGVDIDPAARLGDLSTAERQLVTIARTVSSDGRIILMDEPTAALTHRETQQLLSIIGRLSEQAISFLFISHKLREVAAIADDVTVVRDGRVVSAGASTDYDQARITTLMTGGQVEEQRRPAPMDQGGQPIMEVRGLSLGTQFHDIDLDLYPGRVLGLAGLVGSGRTELGRALAGLLTPQRGEIRYRGEVLDSPRKNARLQYVPEDRLTEGLFLNWSVADNVATNDLDAVTGRAGTLSGSRIVALANHWREKLRIKTPSVTLPASSLSGGNQQRVLLARALAPDPDVIILNNPTMGVDIGSRAAIHDLIRHTADQGKAILVNSDEPAELLSICDDLVFIDEGRAVDRRRAADLDEDGLLDTIGQGARS